MALQGQRRILVPTDFSRPADRALEVAIGYGSVFGGAIVLAHIEEPGEPVDLLSLDERVDRVIRAGVDCVPRIVKGKAWEAIVALAGDEKADILIMGTRGRTGYGEYYLGSVARKVLEHAGCPVLVVPPEPGEQPAIPPVVPR